MFQLSFLNAGLLFLAAATVLPLIIWLLAKKKPRQIIFSTIRFIVKTDKEQQNRTRLKNILLLIIRMLIILLIVLAAARPSLRIPGFKPGKNHPPTAVAILLDTSFSMDYTADSKSNLEKAKARIRDINARLTDKDMSVLITSDENWNKLNTRLQSGAVPEADLNSIKSTYLPMKLDEMLQLADDKLQDSQFTNRETYLLTDGLSPEMRERSVSKVHVLPAIHQGEWENLSCGKAEPVMQLTSRQQTQLISFEVTNHGKSIKRDVLVRIDFNGSRAGEKFITLQPNQKLTETLPVQITQDGWQQGFVEVLDEKLPADNRCWFAFKYDLHPSIAVITQRQSLPAVMQSMLRVYATEQGSVRLLSPNEVTFSNLKDYSVVAVYDAGALTPRLREVLQACSKARQGVLYIADANMQQDWKAWLGQGFGVQLQNFSNNSAAITYANPYQTVTSLLDGKQLTKTPVRDYWTSRNGGSANILLSVDSSPLALAGESSLLWLFDAGSPANRFLLSASFPVFAYRCLQYLSNSGFETERLTVGQSLSADEIILPNGDKTELNGSSMQTLEPGIYALNWRGGNPQRVAVGFDAKESGFIPADLAKDKNFIMMSDKWQQELFQSRLGHDIWMYLLLAVVFLFILEIAIVKSEEWKAGTEKT